ncbi:MAG: hypothetical protein FWH19_02600 [Treponema sp.]|nr:hypothetical protein [Treponema sp.]
MDPEELINIFSRLILGGLASFLAILLWPRIRDPAWMLVIIGIIMAYVETVCSVLVHLGIDAGKILVIGSVSIIPLLLSCLSIAFFIAALWVMVIRKYRRS